MPQVFTSLREEEEVSDDMMNDKRHKSLFPLFRSHLKPTKGNVKELHSGD